jgi:hypothetical protein
MAIAARPLRDSTGGMSDDARVLRTVCLPAGIAAQADGGQVETLRAGLRSELLHAGVGLVVLLTIQVLDVYKPRGMTPYGRRHQQREREADPGSARDTGEASARMAVLTVIAIVLCVLLLALHLSGGHRGMHH